MLADDLIGIGDARQIDRLIPRQQLGQIREKLTGLFFGETDAKFVCGREKELAQDTLMFHVEQLREMRKEVKPLRGGPGSAIPAAARQRLARTSVYAFRGQRATPRS